MRPASSTAATFAQVLNVVLNDGAADNCSRLTCDSAPALPWHSKQNCLNSGGATAENANSAAASGRCASTARQSDSAAAAICQEIVSFRRMTVTGPSIKAH